MSRSADVHRIETLVGSSAKCLPPMASRCGTRHGRGALAVMFVHGWSCDRRYWHRQVGHFAARFTVVTIDLAGS